MYHKVKQFYDRMQFRRPAKPTSIDAERRGALMAYLLNEVLEFGQAAELLEQVDAAVDILYFVMDVFVELGVDPEVPFDIVHQANMSKLWPDGQPRFDHSRVPPILLKPDSWKAPEPQLADWLLASMGEQHD